MTTAKKLAIFDLDGTLFRWQLYHELVFRLKDKGCFTADVSGELDDAFLAWNSRQSSFNDYERRVIKAFVPHLQEIPTATYDETVQEVVEASGHKVYAYTLKLVQRAKKDGYHLLALSGSQQEIVDQFAALYGFDDCIGSLYNRTKDGFTGEISRHVPSSKAELITQYAEEHGFDLRDSLAIGDSHSDVGLLELVGDPIAFNPSEELLSVAQSRGWRIVIERKNIAYTLEPGADTYSLASAEVV